MRLGYACINNELRKQKIFAGRTCRKIKFNQKGLSFVGDLGIQNLRDLLTIVEWNSKHGIHFYRIGSDIFPWSSEYEYSELPQYKEACEILKKIGETATKANQRLTFHPGPFNILGSRNHHVVQRTIKDLNSHSEIFNLMGFEPSVYNKINIHIGAAYGNKKQEVLDSWIENFKLLEPHTQKRLTLENDDKASLFTIEELMYVHQKTGVPLVFDFHHHKCHPGKLTVEEALKLAVSTWPAGIAPIVHYSSARKIEDPKAKIQAHAYMIHEIIDTFDLDVDIMLESKGKEEALLEYRKKNGILY